MTQVSLAVLQKAATGLDKAELKPDLIRKLQTQFLNFAKLETAARIEKFTTKYLQMDLVSFATHLDGHIAERPDQVRPILENTLKSLSKQSKIAGQKHLSLFEYEMHGKKKAPNFQFNRKEIYQIFEWYENKLKAGGLWDELDLVRDVTTVISERDWSGHQYDLVVCDEIQDLTDMQEDLLFYLVKNPNNLLLAGDTKQIINPSGFRWEETKRHFFERGLSVPELHFLTLNFRSSGSIVELSNILLDLKQEFLGVSSGEGKEEWKYKGRPPVVVSEVSEAAMLENVKEAGARRTILVRTEKAIDLQPSWKVI
jgi:superfamily I DNA/RNA helicase